MKRTDDQILSASWCVYEACAETMAEELVSASGVSSLPCVARANDDPHLPWLQNTVLLLRDSSASIWKTQRRRAPILAHKGGF
jgi:hypothetical protein